MNQELIDFFTENPNAITFISNIDGCIFYNSSYNKFTYKYKAIDGIDESYYLYYDENQNIHSIRKFGSNLRLAINQQDINLICKYKNFL